MRVPGVTAFVLLFRLAAVPSQSVAVQPQPAPQAQPEAPCTPGRILGAGGIYLNGNSGYKGPLSIKYRSTSEQKLPDGNAVHSTRIGALARSSSGKLMDQRESGCILGADGLYRPVVYFTVTDRVEGTALSWQTGWLAQTYATLNHQGTRAVQPPPSAKLPAYTDDYRAVRRAIGAETQREDLGHRTIAGVDCVGTRNTRRIPPGEEGNDSQLTTVDEIWRSAELNLDLLIIRDDPRTGKATTEAVEVSREEPDPRVFLPPADYTVWDTSAPAAAAAARQPVYTQPGDKQPADTQPADNQPAGLQLLPAIRDRSTQ
jgi:hypothetical protein